MLDQKMQWTLGGKALGHFNLSQLHLSSPQPQWLGDSPDDGVWGPKARLQCPLHRWQILYHWAAREAQESRRQQALFLIQVLGARGSIEDYILKELWMPALTSLKAPWRTNGKGLPFFQLTKKSFKAEKQLSTRHRKANEAWSKGYQLSILFKRHPIVLGGREIGSKLF